MKNEIKRSCEINIGSDLYPALLKLIPDPPKVLYARGNIDLLKTESVSVVGSRNSTDYGKWGTEKLVEHLVKNDITIISGMAKGIDSYAHKATLDNGGNTIAVLANGTDICYPKSNDRLYQRILDNGLIISESKDGEMPQKYSFPLRNRIISGLSKITVIVEAGLKSGSLITAERAVEQGRIVYAVPGNLNRNTSFGCNKLIADGANIMVTFDDVLKDLGKRIKSEERDYEGLSGTEINIITILDSEGEMTIDGLSEKMKISAPRMTGLITVLEMKGHVQSAYGKIFIEK